MLGLHGSLTDEMPVAQMEAAPNFRPQEYLVLEIDGAMGRLIIPIINLVLYGRSSKSNPL